jgi:hypothetical protein
MDTRRERRLWLYVYNLQEIEALIGNIEDQLP